MSRDDIINVLKSLEFNIETRYAYEGNNQTIRVTLYDPVNEEFIYSNEETIMIPDN